MSAATALRKRDPYRLQQIITYSGRGYRSAGTGKQVAAAHDLHRTRGTRYQIGDVSAPLTHALLALSECEFTTAYPALVQALALVFMAETDGQSDEALRARRAELVQEKFGLDAAAYAAIYDGDDAAAEDAHEKLAALHLELLAILRRLRGDR
jgi:hypothetical protein